MFTKINIHVLLTCFLLFTVIRAQTNEFKLGWDPNSEDDLYMYRVFRSTDPVPNAQLDSVRHPQAQYTDDQINKGVLYYYRIQAVDYSLNGSEFSDIVSAAVPEISGLPSALELPADTTVELNLDDYVDDPDHPDDQLSWTITGQNLLQATVIQATRTAVITTPLSWSSSENLIFTVTDPQDFSDRGTIKVETKGAPAEYAPQFSDIPDQSVAEDGFKQIDLLDYVTDNDSSPEDLSFQVSAVNNISLTLDGSVLSIKPEKDWFGSRNTNVYVSDETGQKDTTQLTIKVLAINDPPQISGLPQLKLGQDSTVVLNLNNYVMDVDDAKSDLLWQFSNYTQLSLSYDANAQTLQISAPPAWVGFEYIRTVVSDDSGASAVDTMVVQVTDISLPPQISGLPDVTFNEDESAQLNLNNYVNDPDDPPSNLYWRARGHSLVQVQINHQTNVAFFSAEKDWFGAEDVWFIVSDPGQEKDSTEIKITVEPVNDPPRFAALPSINLSETKTRTIDLKNYVTDVDDDLSVMQWSHEAPNDVQLDISAEGLAAFSVSESWQGTETVEIYVADDEDGRDTSKAVVYSQNPAKAPAIVNMDTIHINEDGQRILDLNNFVSDPDHAPAQISWSALNNVYISTVINNSVKEVTFTPAADWYGSEKITFRAEDPDGYFDYDTLEVFVDPVNDPPVISAINPIQLYENTIYTLDLKQFISDADGFDDIENIFLTGTNNDFIGHYLDAHSLQITFYTPAGYSGQATFLLRITDSQGAEASGIFIVKVSKKSVATAVAVKYFGSQTDIQMSWETATETRDHIEYGQELPYDAQTEPDAELTTSHEVIISGLEPDQTYHFRIVSENASGVVVYSPDSTFTTGTAEKEVNVFPIPYRAASTTADNGIIFANLPAMSTVTVYNLLGEPVFSTGAPDHIYRWDVTNNAGSKVSSGIYLYLVKDSDNKKVKSGKLIIVR